MLCKQFLIAQKVQNVIKDYGYPLPKSFDEEQVSQKASSINLISP